MYNGYEFYMAGMKLPIAPPSLQIEVGSKNEVVDLINEGEINILKSPSLVSISFEARFPMRTYPYAPNVNDFDTYYTIIKNLKENKVPFDFIVARATPNGIPTWDTNLKMALESFTFKENWDEGDDVLIDFQLKQYKPYGTKTANVQQEIIEMPEETTRVEQTVEQQTYTVKSGDTLYDIAKRMYGDGSKWVAIYEANKDVIEAAAKAHGKGSSSNGHWIWAGTELVLPDGAKATSDTNNINRNKNTGSNTISSSSIKAGDTINTSGSASTSTNKQNDGTYRLSVRMNSESAGAAYQVFADTKSYKRTTVGSGASSTSTYQIPYGSSVTIYVTVPSGSECKYSSTGRWVVNDKSSSYTKTYTTSIYGDRTITFNIETTSAWDILKDAANNITSAVESANWCDVKVTVNKATGETNSHLVYRMTVSRNDGTTSTYGPYRESKTHSVVVPCNVQITVTPDHGYTTHTTGTRFNISNVSGGQRAVVNLTSNYDTVTLRTRAEET